MALKSYQTKNGTNFIKHDFYFLQYGVSIQLPFDKIFFVIFHSKKFCAKHKNPKMELLLLMLIPCISNNIYTPWCWERFFSRHLQRNFVFDRFFLGFFVFRLDKVHNHIENHLSKTMDSIKQIIKYSVYLLTMFDRNLKYSVLNIHRKNYCNLLLLFQWRLDVVFLKSYDKIKHNVAHLSLKQ